MDPISLFTGLQVAGGISTGLQRSAQNSSEAVRLQNEARLHDTQALQRDTDLRGELDRSLSTIQAARAANGLSALSPNAISLVREATEASTEDRQILTGNDRQRAANARAGATAARRGARLSLVTGFVQTRASLT